MNIFFLILGFIIGICVGFLVTTYYWVSNLKKWDKEGRLEEFDIPQKYKR